MWTILGNPGSSDPVPASGRRHTRRRVLMLVALLGGLHLLVASPHFVARVLLGSPEDEFAGVDNFARISDTLWRGAAPSPEAYSRLAEAGAVMIIDLRAEADVPTAQELAAASGLSWVSVPIRDGQPPTRAQVQQVADIIAATAGPVFVHCQAGVGRTGSVIAGLNVAAGQSPGPALIEALRFGPMSLEQQVFIVRSGAGHQSASLIPVAAISRIIDSPRRMWSRLVG